MYGPSASGQFTVASAILLSLTVLPIMPSAEAQARRASPGAADDRSFAAAWAKGTPVTLTGEVVLFHTDDANRRATLTVMIRDDVTGRSHPLRFEKGAPRNMAPGARVKIAGRLVGSDLYVAACCDATASSSVQQLVAAPAPPVGDQRTLVMIADLLDASVSCSTDNVRATLFAPPTNVFDDNGNGLSVNGEYLASSYGRVSWSGEVRRSTLNIQSTAACDLDLYSRTLNAEAAAAGIDLTAYPRKLYVFPPMSQCPYIGVSTTGATSSSFTFSCTDRVTYSHELGHGLGMSHAAAYYDAYTAGSGDYSNRLNEYGDYSDSMGAGGWQFRGFNAPHRDQMGWLPWTAVQIVNQSGLYNLAPLSMDPSAVSAPQAIKIPKADGGFYYLSYRGGQLFDRYLSWFVTRVSVHRYGAPADALSGATFLYAALANGIPGQDTFTDPVNGITVRMVSGLGTAPGAGAVVDITINAPVPAPRAPGGIRIVR